ncbi:MAG: LuxR C-terminal-related transcriptional regulator [Candidatus Baltobacteraceae bacterium]
MNRLPRLARHRVTRRIARAAEYPIALLIAPAGFGKSVALADYLLTERIDHSRYDVRRDHNTLFEFVRGMTKALEARVPSAIAAFPEAQERAMAADDAAGELARWMSEHLSREQTIVVDDLHNAADDSRSIGFLSNLMERTMDRVRWIIASRSSLDLPVASWLAYEKMDEPIGEDELRFTTDEGLAAAEEGAIDQAGAQELLRLTSGWPVAFSIGLRSSARIADLEKLADGTREMIYRYLAEQVYRRLDDDERKFLLETSVYPWLDLTIIERRGDSPKLLARLRRDAGFIYAASEKEYRYHDLFRDFLENELRSHGVSAYTRALCEAATTLEHLERTAEGLVLYIRAASTDDVVRLLEASGFELMERGRTDIIEAALTFIPVDRRSASAVAMGMDAILSSRRGDGDIAEQQYKRSIELAKDPLTRAELVYRYCIDLVREGREEAIELLAPYSDDESLGLSLRASVLATLATAHTKASNGPSAKRYIEQSLMLLERSPSALQRAKIYQQAAFVMLYTGEAQRAAQYANSAIEIANEHRFYEIGARAYSVLYNVSKDFEDDPIGSLGHLEELANCARKGGSRQLELYALLGVCDIEAERGNQAALDRLDVQIGALGLPLRGSVIETLLPTRALRAAWDRDFALAYRLLKDTNPSHGGRRALRLAEIAVYAVAGNASAQADETMAACYAELRTVGRPSPRSLRTSLFLAIAELLRRRDLAAHRLIDDVEREAGSMSARLRSFARAVRALYNNVLDAEGAPALAAALERLRSQEMGGLALLLSVLPFAFGESGGLSLLTASERAILKALSAGASSKQIASDTGRSPQTVDVHIRSICRKLGCSGRIEAIAVARDAGWLAAG